MSQEGSEGWETASALSDQGDQRNANAGTSQDSSGPVAEPDLSFSKKSPEEVQSDARNNQPHLSISSRLSRLSIPGLTPLPPQPPCQQPQASNSPEIPSLGPQHDRTRSPTSPVIDRNNSTSPTQKRGPGVPRNPVSDTWRDDAYTKKDSGKGKMVDVEKQQDRWRCENCGHLNERGIAKDTSEAKIKGIDENALVGVPGPSRPSPHATRQPVPISGSIPPGVAPGEVVKCAHCGDQMFIELSRYDPRGLAEDGVRWNAVEEPDEIKALRKEVARGSALKRVRERWKEDEKRHEEEEKQKSTEEGRGDGSGVEREGVEDETVGETGGKRKENKGKDPATQYEGEDDEWEDED